MLVIYATLPIDPAYRDDAIDLAEDLAVASRGEDGVVDYRVATDVEEPTLLRFVEQYEDEAAFDAHTETEHFQAFQSAVPDVLAGEPDVIRFEVAAATEVDV